MEINHYDLLHQFSLKCIYMTHKQIYLSKINLDNTKNIFT